ncbi:MAG: hypothetical protein IPF87_19375 [Gemmatimonadetes bacterium]|nr:hypothetical protein [Gemmatimonadota bacterium]MBK9410501.1 hypothetical protein [Gemmatimonadota bacterium]
MELKTKLGLQTLRRAHAFLAGKAVPVAVGELKPHIEALDSLVVRLEQFATEQASRANAARAATDTKRAMARELRQEYLRPISVVARRLFANDAQLRSAFVVPAARDDEGLIQAANAFAERVEEFKDRFAARGLAEDLVDRLRKATNTFRDTLTNRSLDLARRSAATAGMLSELSRGRDLVRLLDLMLAPRLVGEPENLAEWRSIVRFVRSATITTEGGNVPATVTQDPVSQAA